MAAHSASRRRIFDWMLKIYRKSLTRVLQTSVPDPDGLRIATMVLTGYLYTVVPSGFFPQQDTGRLNGSVQADQDISFAAMKEKMQQFVAIVMKDPNVQSIVGFAGGNTAKNQGRMFITLKPKGKDRTITADQVIGEMRRKLSAVPGATLFMQSAQDLSIGARQSQAQYQYTLQGEDLDELNSWAPKVLQKLKSLKELRDVNTDQQNRGLDSQVIIDRDTASRLGVSPQDIDNALYDAFGQRQVSTIYRQLNQYHVVMEVAPQYQTSPEALQAVYVRSANGPMIPLSAIAHFGPANVALAVNHQGQFPAATISFNLAPGVSLGARHQGDRCGREANRIAGHHSSRAFRAMRRAYQEARCQPAGLDHYRCAHGLYRARNPVRELHSSHHHSVDPAVGWFRRASGAADHRQRAERDGHDRNHSADWHREEKRDHDD